MPYFTESLIKKLFDSQFNFFPNNYDHLRFGAKPNSGIVKRLGIPVRNWLRQTTAGRRLYCQQIRQVALAKWAQHFSDLEWLYSRFDDDYSRNLLVDLVAYRLLGASAVALPLGGAEYWKIIDETSRLGDSQNSIRIRFNDWNLEKFDLNRIGYPLKVYSRVANVVAQFRLEQYACDRLGARAGDNDIVIDGGGCFGDTALYFANAVGGGKVYTFEFVASNIEVMRMNLELNGRLAPQIQLVPHPLWDESDVTMHVVDNGPGSTISFEAPSESDERTSITTVTIDDFVAQHAMNRVDFIKMDIEGAEYPALQGARHTIERFRPTLALCVYNSPDDFTRLARFIDEFNIGCKLSLDNFTIHNEETVLFATCDELT